jgi:hypothetical protein
MEGDEHCYNAKLVYYRYLMKAAQNIVVMTQCKGVFLAGDNQCFDSEFFKIIAEKLKNEFESFTKPDWVNNIVFYRQTKPFNFNLQGTLYFLQKKISKNHLD